jgi:hypothetical protein
MLTATVTHEPAPLTGSVVQDLYGIGISTPWPLAGVAARTAGTWEVAFEQGEPEAFAEARSAVPDHLKGHWTQGAALPDGSRYRRWENLFEFLVASDGRQIRARFLPDSSEEAFLAYLLVDALSFSMIRLGREPLHATAVHTDGGVVAFIGRSGDGKSTLGALFVQSGMPLVTDDMLVTTAESDWFVAHPGPPRIKLYREMARLIFGDGWHGAPMNPATDKLIVPLKESQAPRRPGVLRALYLIGTGQIGPAHTRTGQTSVQPARPEIRRLRPAEAFPRILAATATHWADEPARLKAQFAFVTRLVERVPVNTLVYPRNWDQMASVRDAVLADLARRPE